MELRQYFFHLKSSKVVYNSYTKNSIITPESQLKVF